MTDQKDYQTALWLRASGRPREAEQLCRQILARQPRHLDALQLLAVLASESGRMAEAANILQSVAQLEPNRPEVQLNLGAMLASAGRADEAILAFTRAISLQPNRPESHYNLGLALSQTGQREQAAEAYRRAIGLRPDYAEAWNNLGNVLEELRQLDRALEAYHRAIARRPDYWLAFYNLGTALEKTGQVPQAIEAYRKAEQLGGGNQAAQNLLYALHFDSTCPPQQLWQEHARWNATYARPLLPANRIYQNERSPERRLKIGYVSADFREHPVGRFLLPLFAHHDHEQFEIICYDDTETQDRIGPQFQSHADQWRKTRGMSDAQLAELIASDTIDVLVDLGMHMRGNRMLAFARKPAPVQVTYLAYIGTTGLEAMDYRLTDPYLDPPDQVQDVYSERSVWLPRTYWCYPAPDAAPEVGPLPALATGSVTFGCLNNFSKVSPATVAAWKVLLNQVPSSRLVLHAPEGRHRNRLLDEFTTAGVQRDRIRFVGMLSGADYFNLYNTIDIALDPFPCPGGTTTCDALLMGVPVVTCTGEPARSRAGLSILSNLGAPERVARSPEEYVEIAVRLAADLEALQAIRGSLRQMMLESPLMDAPAFARDIEAAYRTMWRGYCHTT